MNPTYSDHIPVLFEAVMSHAHVKAGEVWVDCTLGRGGHTEGLLRRGAQVIAFDRDEEALFECQTRLKSFIEDGQLRLIHSDFRALQAVLEMHKVNRVDGLLADLGVSSPQLDRPERGFSFMSSGPLDMRMDPSQGLSAAEWLSEHDVHELERVLRRYGEEPRARALSRIIKAWSDEGGGDTLSLAQLIEAATPMKIRRQQKKHPATRSFQALRIAVNDELGALEDLLEAIPRVLNLGGKALLISFHSLEDRAIKHAYKALSEAPAPPRRGLPPPPSAPPEFMMEPRKGVVADEEELTHNPRARSARLRIITRIRDEGERREI